VPEGNVNSEAFNEHFALVSSTIFELLRIANLVDQVQWKQKI
jgi:hypothetical protein